MAKKTYKILGTNYRHKACNTGHAHHGRTSYKTAKEEEIKKMMDDEIRTGPLEKILKS